MSSWWPPEHHINARCTGWSGQSGGPLAPRVTLIETHVWMASAQSAARGAPIVLGAAWQRCRVHFTRNAQEPRATLGAEHGRDGHPLDLRAARRGLRPDPAPPCRGTGISRPEATEQPPRPSARYNRAGPSLHRRPTTCRASGQERRSVAGVHDQSLPRTARLTSSLSSWQCHIHGAITRATPPRPQAATIVGLT
jgi:hypothetical protein